MGAGELSAGAADDALVLRPPRRERARRARGGLALERWIVPLLTVHDLAAAALAYVIAFGTRMVLPVPLTTASLPDAVAWQPHPALALLLATQLPALYVLGLYDVRLLRDRSSALPGALAAVVAQIAVVGAWYFFRGAIDFPRSVLLLYALGNVTLLAASRAAVRHLLRRGRFVLRTALVGAPADVAELHAQLAPDAARHGIELVGAVRAAGGAFASETASGDGTSPRWLGTTRDLGRILRGRAIEQLIVVPGPSETRDALLDAVLRAGEGAASLRVAVVPSVYELRVGRLASLHIDDVPLIEVVRDPRDAPAFRAKAALDYVLATLLLVLALPLCALAAVAIGIGSPGPVLFRQRRVGRGGREFIVYKLRTMHEDAEHATGPVLASDGDARVTWPGRFLRATRIDEFPQLMNVLNGTMSLVGPRPERPEFAESLAREIPGYRERWLVKPGLTGLAQVRGEYHTSPSFKLKYDLAYIHNHSLLLDVRILIETVKALLTRRGV